jgi:hypothetical protein
MVLATTGPWLAATGTIVLHDSFDFSGVVSGFNGDDHLDLLDVAGPDFNLTERPVRAHPDLRSSRCSSCSQAE